MLVLKFHVLSKFASVFLVFLKKEKRKTVTLPVIASLIYFKTQVPSVLRHFSVLFETNLKTALAHFHPRNHRTLRPVFGVSIGESDLVFNFGIE